MFVDAALAARIEHADARCAVDIVERLHGSGMFAMPAGRGAAIYVRPGSPMNKIVGAGFDGAVDLAPIAAAYAARGEAVKVELSSLADPAVFPGFHVSSVRHVLAGPVAAIDVRTPDITIETDGDVEEWIAVSVEGFATLGRMARVDLEAVIRDGAASRGTRYLARVDGVAAGVAAVNCEDRVAFLYGATTVAAARGRGVHRALIAARMAQAARAGCDVAVVTTAAGSPSQRNLTRDGFEIAYARLVLAKGP